MRLLLLIPVLLLSACSNAEHRRLVDDDARHLRSGYRQAARADLRREQERAHRYLDAVGRRDAAVDPPGPERGWPCRPLGGTTTRRDLSSRSGSLETTTGLSTGGPLPGRAARSSESRSPADATARSNRWERYDSTGLIAAEEDTDHDGAPDKWETYARGALLTAGFDETGDGKPDRLLTYEAGTLATIATAPDSSGRFMKKIDVRRPDDPRHRP